MEIQVPIYSIRRAADEAHAESFKLRENASLEEIEFCLSRVYYLYGYVAKVAKDAKRAKGLASRAKGRQRGLVSV